MILPHEAKGNFTPRPRKERVDSVRIVPPTCFWPKPEVSSAVVRLVRHDELASTVLVTIHEGRNRQVRRMFEAIGHQVVSLRRVGFGPIRLGDLPRGMWRRLTDEEVRRLKEC